MPRPLRVFVHLAYDKDVVRWRMAREAGTLVGVNDETPYGYGRAERMGCRVAFSHSHPEGGVSRFVRLGLRAVSGFDLLHAWRQGSALREADVVWTHTESQFLAVAAVLWRRRWRPKLIAQSVWLFDRWPRFSRFHRWLFGRLIERVDVLTVHSPDNLAEARRLFPRKRSMLIPFGIPAEAMVAPQARTSRPVTILGVGSDGDRDWATLVQAVSDADGWHLLLYSGTADARLAAGRPNVRIGRATSKAELDAAYAGAAVLCVPLLPNKHASGITVIQEAVLAGLPVIASDTGGLSTYFGADAIRFVPVGDPRAMRQAIADVLADPAAAQAMARRAQERMREADLGTEAFIRAHVDLSRELVAP